jgi:Family of unknown function (DUF6464)
MKRENTERSAMNHIGNSDCKHNAYSPHLRCAINPCGPCECCPDYARASLSDRISRRLQLVRNRNRNRKSLLRIGLEISLGLAGAIAIGVPTGLYVGLSWVMYSEQEQIARRGNERLEN